LFPSHDQRLIKEQFANDPKAQKKALSELRFQHNMKEAAIKDAQSNNYEQAIDMVNNRMSPVQIQATNKDVWNGMSELQRNNILSGKHMVTDQKILSELRALPRSELKELNASDFAGQLKPADVQKLGGWIETAKKGQSLTHIQTPGKMTANAFKALYGTRAMTSSKPSAVEARNEFYETVESAIEEAEIKKDAKLTPTETREIIKSVTTPLIEQRSFAGIDFLSPDEVLTVKDVGPKQLRELNNIKSQIVLDGEMTEEDADRWLIRARTVIINGGYEPTTENILKLYNASKQ